MNHTTWEPDLVSPALLSLTTLLGEPERDLVVLAEGNTSELLDDGRLVVKASGAALAHAKSEEFVVVDVDEVMAVVDDPATTQTDLSDVLPSDRTAPGHGAARSRQSSTLPSTPWRATPGSRRGRGSSGTRTRRPS